MAVILQADGKPQANAEDKQQLGKQTSEYGITCTFSQNLFLFMISP